LSRIEVRMGKIEEWIRKKEEEERSVGMISSKGEGTGSVRSTGSERGDNSGRSEDEASVRSSLSTREVERIRRWMTDKDREERRRNIILKGVKIPREIGDDRKRATV